VTRARKQATTKKEVSLMNIEELERGFKYAKNKNKERVTHCVRCNKKVGFKVKYCKACAGLLNYL